MTFALAFALAMDLTFAPAADMTFASALDLPFESVIVHRSVHGVLCVELRVVAERGSRKLLTRAHHQEEDPSLLITLFPRESTVCELVNVRSLAIARWRVLAAGTGYILIKRLIF